MAYPFGFPEPRLVDAGEVTFSVHEAGPADGTPLLMLHGWPEIAFSWAPMVDALTAAGCRLIMPDIKGFGGTKGPTDVNAYTYQAFAEDYQALLDSLGVEKAVFVGHDWGGAIVWPLTQRLPERCLGVASFCTPFREVTPVAPLSLMEKTYGDRHYIVQFQDQKLPDRVFGGHEADFFKFMFRPGPDRSRWGQLMPGLTHLPDRFTERKDMPGDVLMNDEVIEVYARAYQSSGHETSTMVYRAIDRHWEERKRFDPEITLPALMVSATRDVFLPPEASEGMEARVPNLTREVIDSGHWVTWEAPEAATEALLTWLRHEGFLPA